MITMIPNRVAAWDAVPTLPLADPGVPDTHSALI